MTDADTVSIGLFIVPAIRSSDVAVLVPIPAFPLVFRNSLSRFLVPIEIEGGLAVPNTPATFFCKSNFSPPAVFAITIDVAAPSSTSSLAPGVTGAFNPAPTSRAALMLYDPPVAFTSNTPSV